ncbi:winged helix DNA-binding domain-containing protein [Nocardiopsis gilva YIM 90087]|uniref:Winged helix DNA-binding domain-containing protein n=1 Tax=Nocardiopsis gilva YIM 90087 TaxID=1235441 RepID=A0A223S2E6_9ACTN|nr:winged helix DNA-binding domain-containing protein [Nocardiopsis gilva]ASU82294.1 winged helix DNA-binding domain-containing protein [Nocardiopsis gilva YIM 90087]
MSSARRRVTPAERRARLAERHLLAAGTKATDTTEVVDALVALHATDPATVYLSVASRLPGATREEIEDALYRPDLLLRTTCMRQTLFVVGRDLAPAVIAASGRAAAAQRTKGLLRIIRESEVGDEQWLERVGHDVIRVLRERGSATTAELAEAVPGLEQRFALSPGKKYESSSTVAAFLLFILAAEGRIMRGPRRGGWTSNMHAWTPGPEFEDFPETEGRAELARRWLASFGPGTVDDLKWWTGWTVTATRAALADVGAVEVELDEGVGYVLPEDLEPPRAEPEAAAMLLPGLDPTPMGWRHRDFYLDPDHRPALFDRMGNIGPTVWWKGRIIGGWAQRSDGEIAWRLLPGVDPGQEAHAAISAAAEQLTDWLGDARFTPSYRTPLERELAG